MDAPSSPKPRVGPYLRVDDADYGDGVLDAIRRHAEATYPHECCGLVLHDGVHRSENVQDELHAEDPVAHPRTARDGFVLAPRDQLRLARAHRAGTARALYHSHVDTGAYLSDADLAGATLAGRPLYPGVDLIVVSCRGERAGEIAVYRPVSDASTS